MTAQEIVDKLKARGKSVHVQTIYQYKSEDKWRPVIQKFRERYTARLDDVPGAHKRVRLARMDETANSAMEDKEYGAVVSATRQQQMEMEGNDNSRTGNTIIFQQYNHMTDEEIERRKDQLLRFLESRKTIEVKKEGE